MSFSRMGYLFCAAVLVGTALVSASCSTDHYAADFQSRSATQKREYFEQRIQDSLYEEGTWPGKLEMLQLFTESMMPTENHVCDEFPHDRKKLIHSVGAGAWMELVSTGNHEYTGLFKGAKNVLGRVSPAVEPGTQESALDAQFTPGAGFKMLRSGQPSGNFPAMRDVKPQDSWNPFAYPFSNHVSGKNLALPQKLLAKKFRTASAQWALLTGISHLATHDEDGNEVPHSQVRFPFQLVLEPSTELMNDESFGPGNLVKVLKQIPVNTKLWTVYAIASPTATKMEHIGDIVLRTPFVAANYLDNVLFLKHQLFEYDLKYDFAKQWPFEGDCPNDVDCQICPVDKDCPAEVDEQTVSTPVTTGCPFLPR